MKLACFPNPNGKNEYDGIINDPQNSLGKLGE
jgi:hypothetical protein